jgi:hypothetical protein
MTRCFIMALIFVLGCDSAFLLPGTDRKVICTAVYALD